jgi:hypothetical protein
MQKGKTPEEEYRLLAKEARVEADWEFNLFERRQLLLSAQRYENLAERAKRAAETRRSRRKKSA